MFAHSGPVYLRVPGTPHRRAEAAGAFLDEIEASKRFIRKRYVFAGQADMAVAIRRFEKAQDRYVELVRESV